jgi:hypothetical protein
MALDVISTLLGLLALGNATSSEPSLEALARQGDPIAVVTIERVHVLEAPRERVEGRRQAAKVLRVAEARVERCLLGRPREGESLFIPLRPNELKLPGLAPASRAVVFCEPRRGIQADSRLEQQLAALAGSSSPRHLLSAGSWQIDFAEGRDVVLIPDEVFEFPRALDRNFDAETVPLDPLLAWLDGELDRITPSAGASLGTTGPRGYSLELDPEGRYRGTESGVLDTDRLASFWRTLEEARFESLPDLVGKSKHPDQNSFQVWTRDRTKGLHLVRIFAVPPEELDSDAAREELARALRVWDSFPGATGSSPR